ncbi:nucleoside hydrolase [Bacillaceae bacterium JMAK1]|nr:nucleoside hydrolase [Bacillaceae bacterium JMAK1]
MTKKIIVDVDTGIDDALGLLLLAHQPNVDVLGVSVVSGNISLHKAICNTHKVLDLIGLDVPIFAGAEQPLVRQAFFEHAVHGDDGIGGALHDAPFNDRTENETAWDYFIRITHDYPGEITLVLTGPMTNFAHALKKDPSIVHRLKEVVFMGGAANGNGNVTPVAEFNMYVDPEAAKLVLHSGVPLTMIGLDVTEQALMSKEDVESLVGTGYYSFIREATAIYFNVSWERNGIKEIAMHDPLAIAVAIGKPFVTTFPYYVDVETNSTLCDGQTVCDYKNGLQRTPNVHVAKHVDAKAFIADYIQHVGLRN